MGKVFLATGSLHGSWVRTYVRMYVRTCVSMLVCVCVWLCTLPKSSVSVHVAKLLHIPSFLSYISVSVSVWQKKYNRVKVPHFTDKRSILLMHLHTYVYM